MLSYNQMSVSKHTIIQKGPAAVRLPFNVLATSFLPTPHLYCRPLINVHCVYPIYTISLFSLLLLLLYLYSLFVCGRSG